MNPEDSLTPREALEVRMTTLLMGELPAEEAAAFEKEIAADAELAALFARLRHALGLLREAHSVPEDAHAEAPLRLSAERREKLLATFRGIRPLPTPVPRVVKQRYRTDWRWVGPMGLAAAVMAVLGVSLSFPASSRISPRALSAYQWGERGELPASAELGTHWKSQAGAIRSFDQNGDGATNGRYTLYEGGKNSSLGDIAPDAPAGPSTAPAQVVAALPYNALPILSSSVADNYARVPEAAKKPAAMPASPVAGVTVLGAQVAQAETNREFSRTSGTLATGKDISGIYLPAPAEAAAANAPADAKPAIALSDFGTITEAPRGAVANGGISRNGVGTTGNLSFNGGDLKGMAASGSIIVNSDGIADVESSTKALQNFEVKKGIAVTGGTVPVERFAAPQQAEGSVRATREAMPAIISKPAAEADTALADSPAPIDAHDFSEPLSTAGKINLNTPLKPFAYQPTRPAPEPGLPALGQAAGEEKFADAKGNRAAAQNEWYFAQSLEGTKTGNLAATGDGGKAVGKAEAEFEGFINYGSPIPPASKSALGLETANVVTPSISDPAGAADFSKRKLEPQSGGRPGNGVVLTNAIDSKFFDEQDGKARQQVAKVDDTRAAVDLFSDSIRMPEGGEKLGKLRERVDDRAAVKALGEVELLQKQSSISELKGEEQIEEKVLKNASAAAADGERAGGLPGAMQGRMGAARAKGYVAPVKAEDKVTSFKTENRKADEDGRQRKAGDKTDPSADGDGDKRSLDVLQSLQTQSRPAAEPPPPPKPQEPAPIPQPEVLTKDNAFSTFSLNVSDVAFKLAAASLEKGAMPEPASMRSEEFLNALDYRDPEPAAGVPLAFASERARYPFAQNRDLLRLSVKTAAVGRQAGKPLNLVLLLDNSGSMERADRVRILHEALGVLAKQLQPQDKLSIITFARTPRLWADGVAGDKATEYTDRVGEITPQGGTDLSSALDLGYQTALRHYQVGSVNRVVLLTDGAANLGDVRAEVLKKKVEAHRKQGVAFDCFGVGWEGYNDDLLEQLSRNGDGRYGFINSPEAAATEFAGQLAGALRVAASDVKVQVEFNPRRVNAYRQIGYAKHQLKKEQFRDNTVDAAEIGAAECGNSLYVLDVNPRGEGDIATVRVRFKDPGTAEYHEHEWTVPFTPAAPALEQAGSSLRLAGAAAAFAEWLAQSPYAAEVTTDRLLGLVNGLPAIYGADPRPQKLEWMIRQAKSISGR